MEYKIYKIVCNETDEVYIGKTTKTLEERLRHHRFNGNSTNSKQIILRGDYVMSQIDECDTEEESIELEAFYIRNTDNCVNIQIPGRTRQEYYEENKDEILEKNKEYREENRENILQKKKEYYYNNRGEILKKCNIYYENNIDHKKEYDKEYYEKNKDTKIIQTHLYYETNRDKVLKKQKEYREKNKDEISEKSKEKYTCECGSILTKTNKARHERESKQHLDFINSK
jgi:hypothetical protein